MKKGSGTVSNRFKYGEIVLTFMLYQNRISILMKKQKSR